MGGCFNDNGENLDPDPNANCNLTNVTFSGTVKPILSGNCLSCHSTAAASTMGGGIKLENHSDLSVQVTNGKLYGAISHSSGYSPMPKGGDKLAACPVSQIKKWIDNGAPNN
jgi:hypothetical protein